MNREVKIYIGFPFDYVSDEGFNPVITDSMTGWSALNYNWFRATVNVPIKDVTDLGKIQAVEIEDE